MKKMERSLEFGKVDRHRREDCLHYESCLEQASAMLWNSFSCSGCDIYCRNPHYSRCFTKTASALGWEAA